MRKVFCEHCQVEIPQERLELLPDTVRCTEHSDTKKYVGFSVYDHKTAPRLALIKGDDEESIRRAERSYRRER